MKTTGVRVAYHRTLWGQWLVHDVFMHFWLQIWKIIMSRSPSPAPMVRDYVPSRSPSCTPLTHGRVDERGSMSQSPQMLEVVVVRSPSPMRFGHQPTTTSINVLAHRDPSMSASPYLPPATYTEDSSSKLSPQLPHWSRCRSRGNKCCIAAYHSVNTNSKNKVTLLALLAFVEINIRFLVIRY